MSIQKVLRWYLLLLILYVGNINLTSLQAYLYLVGQDRSAWTWEMDSEYFIRSIVSNNLTAAVSSASRPREVVIIAPSAVLPRPSSCITIYLVSVTKTPFCYAIRLSATSAHPT